MKVVFLDIDGVCNCNSTRVTTSDGWCFVEDELIARVKKIVDATGAKIVLSSTWRDCWHPEDERANEISFIELREKFREFGMEFYDKTGEWHKHRGQEIQEYLDAHKDIESFVIIDDWPDMLHLVNRLVHTRAATGITDEDVENAIWILNRPFNGSREPVYLNDLCRTFGDCFIEYRTNYPKSIENELSDKEKEYGMAFGWCEYKDGVLISGDSDNYYLDDVIEKYEVHPLSGDLTVWIWSGWSTDEE